MLNTAYNLFLHPLRTFPGPKAYAATRIFYTRMFLSGEPHRRILDLHKRYGPIVRVAPDMLSCNHPDAMNTLRGHRKSGKAEHSKDPIQQQANRHNIIGANRADHTRFRRSLAHGFSAQAMLNQQPIIMAYVDQMLRKLDEQCAGGTRPVNIVQWYNYTTFDLIGDLAFGESFGCLDNSVYHPWVALIFASIKSLAWSISINRYPTIARFLTAFVPREVATKWAEHTQLSQAKTRKRLAMNTERPDFIDAMIRRRGSEKDVKFADIKKSSGLLP